MTLEGALGLALVAGAAALVLVLREKSRVEKRFAVYFAAGEFAKALPFARKLATRRADPLVRGRRQQNLGSVLLKLRRFDDARAALEEALETQLGANDPTASLTRANLAWLELARGKPDRAHEHASAIAGNPEHATRSRSLLAAALVVEGKPGEARDLLAPLAPSPGTKEGQGDGVALAVLAAASRQLGENERSLELARAARVRMSPAQRDELRAILPRVFSVLD